jgi:hypothetical protein
VATLPKVTVTGTVYEADGATLYSGPISFWMPVTLRHSDGTIVLPSEASQTVLAVNGAVSVDLLYVDHPDWTPQDWSWEVRIPRGSLIKRYGLKPSVDDPDDVNLGDLLIEDYTPDSGTEYAAVSHIHPISQVSDLQPGLDAKVDESGGTMTGDLVLSAGGKLRITGNPGTFRQIHFASGLNEEDVRWSLNVDNGAESGGNAGSRLQVVRYSDTGVALDAVAIFNRTNASVELPGAVSVTGGLTAETVARLGSKNGSANVRVCGYLDSARPPVSGAWDLGDVLLTWSGWIRCVSAGTPGTWISLGEGNPRLATIGEFVLDRTTVQSVVKPVTGKLYVTTFVAAETRTVAAVRTATKAAAVGTGSSWIGFMQWDPDAGANGRWLPHSVSVDDPTRWSGAGLTYSTSVYAVTPGTGLANLASPGFAEVAGNTYAYWTLWNDDGATVGRTGPELYATELSPLDVSVLPQIALAMDLAAPPSSFLERDWLTGADRAYQGWMQP